MSVDAEIVLKASDRELDRNLDNAHKKLRGKMARLGKDFAGALGNGLKTGLDLVGIGGIGSIVAAGRGVANFQKDLTRLQISSGKTKREILDLERQLFSVGKAKGVDPDELLAGAAAYTAATGDLQSYVDGLEGLGETATATGASVSDLSNVAQALTKNLGIAGKEWGSAFDVLAAQGKSGAVELDELARELAGLTPQFATFGTTGVDGLRELGAMLQITRSGFGSTAEAATGLRAVMTNLVQNAAKFKAGNVNVFEKGPDGQKHLRDLADIVEQIGESKMFKDPTKLQKAFGSSEAYRALLPLIKAGRDGIRDLANIKAEGTIAKDFKTFMDSPAGKMQSASAAIKEAFNESLKGNIEGIAKAMQKVADLIAWVGNHPYLAAALYAGARGGAALLSAFGGDSGGGKRNAGQTAADVAGSLGSGNGAGGKLARAAGGVAAVGSAFAVGYSIGTAFDQATGASRKLSDAMLRFAGKLDDKYEALVARDAEMKSKIDQERQTLKYQVEAGMIRPTAATEAQAQLRGAANMRATEAERLRDRLRRDRMPVNVAGGEDPMITRAFAGPLGVMMQAQADARVRALDTKAKRAPILAEDLLGFAQQVDPRVAGADPAAAAQAASSTAIKLLSDRGPNGAQPSELAAMMIEELRKAAGVTGGKIEVVVRVDDSGRLVGEMVEDSPHQRRR